MGVEINMEIYVEMGVQMGVQMGVRMGGLVMGDIRALGPICTSVPSDLCSANLRFPFQSVKSPMAPLYGYAASRLEENRGSHVAMSNQ